jgi:hypothetical protein
MNIGIWYRHESGSIEKIDIAYSKGTAAYLVREYQLAFALLPGQRRHGKDFVWAGKKTDLIQNIFKGEL